MKWGIHKKIFWNFNLTVAFLQQSICAFLTDHPSHHMFSLTLLIIDFLLEYRPIRVEFLLKIFDEIQLFLIFFPVIHRISQLCAWVDWKDEISDFNQHVDSIGIIVSTNMLNIQTANGLFVFVLTGKAYSFDFVTFGHLNNHQIFQFQQHFQKLIFPEKIQFSGQFRNLFEMVNQILIELFQWNLFEVC